MKPYILNSKCFISLLLKSTFEIFLVVLLAGMVLAPVQVALAAGTYTVNRADDIAPRGTGVTCITAASSDCTLREAVIKANANPGSTIQFAAALNGTPIVLTRIGNDATASLGDLDINASTNIVGNGSSNTIVQAAANASYAGTIGDKVFGINQDGTFDSLTVHFSGLTIRYGDNNVPNGDPSFAYTGGGVDVFQTGAGNVTTFTDCVISFNRNRNSYGGGLNFDQSAGASGSLSLTNVTFDSNKTLGVTGGQSTGGALNIFGTNAVVTISNSTFTNNLTTPTTSGGGAIYFRPTTNMSLLIHNSDFNGNTSGGIGGGIYVNIPAAGAAGTIVTIDQGTQIRNNVSGGVSGGSAGGSGLFLGGGTLTATPMLLSKVTISGNHDGTSAASHNGGGGIFIERANVTVQYSRIVNNTVSGGATGTGLFKSIDTGTVTATNNWWGCSTGPGAAPCDTAVIAGGSSGSLTSSPYLRLVTTAVPSTINVGQNSAITASFLTNSASTIIPVANLDVLLGLPVAWNAVHGSLSGQQTTIQANGNATATLTQDNTCNNSSVTAQVDHGPASGGPNTSNITIQCPDLTAVKSNNVSGSTTLPTGWTWQIHIANVGSGFAAFASGNTILADNLPNSGLTYGSPSVSGASGLTGAVSCSIDGITKDLSCNASGGAVQLAAAGSFDVTFSATPNTGGSYANPRGAGSCSVDPGSAVPESNEANNTCTNTVTVNTPPSITSANNATFTVGSAGTFTITTNPGYPTATIISETGALPSSITFTDNGGGTATLAGTPGAGTSGSYPLTITASNGILPNATQSFTLTVNQIPSITSANNTTFTVGSAGTFMVTTTGFPGGASMTLGETGALPTGVTFTNNGDGTATLAGTPAAGTGGTYPILLTASNGVSPDATQNFTLTVNQAPTSSWNIYLPIIMK